MRTVEDQQSKRVGIGLAPPVYDKVTVLYPDGVTEVYTYSLLDAAGNETIMGYVEVVYATSDKENLVSVRRLAQ